MSINNLLKSLLSKPETKLIQRKYETKQQMSLFKFGIKFLWRAYLYMLALTHCKLNERGTWHPLFLGGFPIGGHEKKRKCESNRNAVTLYFCIAIRREKDDTDRIFWKGLIFLFLFQPVAKYLFESRDSYVVTYKAMYVSTKNSVKLNPYSKLRSGVDLTPSSFFCLVKTI